MTVLDPRPTRPDRSASAAHDSTDASGLPGALTATKIVDCFTQFPSWRSGHVADDGASIAWGKGRLTGICSWAVLGPTAVDGRRASVRPFQGRHPPGARRIAMKH